MTDDELQTAMLEAAQWAARLSPEQRRRLFQANLQGEEAANAMVRTIDEELAGEAS